MKICFSFFSLFCVEREVGVIERGIRRQATLGWRWVMWSTACRSAGPQGKTKTSTLAYENNANLTIASALESMKGSK